MGEVLTALAKTLVWSWAIALAVVAIAFVVYDPGESAAFVPPALMAVVMGALISTRVRGNPIGTALLIGGSAWLLYANGRNYASLSVDVGPLPGAYVAAWLGAWVGPLFYLSFPTLFLLFPDGRPTRFGRWLLVVVGCLALLTVAGAIPLWGTELSILIDDAALSADSRYVLTDTAFLLSLWMTIPSTFAIVSRYRTGDPVTRQQMRWLLFGGIALAASLSFAPLMDDSELWGVALAIGMSLLPVGVGVAVFKYRLYDLGRVVSRTVSYLIVVATLGFVFAVGVVFIPNQLLRVEDPPAILVAASTLVAAALFNPLRKWVHNRVDRRFNRSRYDAAIVMDEFAGSLRDGVDGVALIEGWVGVVEETMQPSLVGVWVR